jgi:dihydroxy-acid dehydratase
MGKRAGEGVSDTKIALYTPKGSLCPGSAVIKVSGKKLPPFRGPAKCYDSEQEAYAAVISGKVLAGDALVIRYQGPSVGRGQSRVSAAM